MVISVASFNTQHWMGVENVQNMWDIFRVIWVIEQLRKREFTSSFEDEVTLVDRDYCTD